METLNEQESGLLKALQVEADQSIVYLQSEVTTSQIDALKRYFGDAYGDEVDGRSQVTTREVYETVRWLLPDLNRIFTSGDRVVDFHPTKPQDDDYCEAAADYVNYIFLEDNPGARLINEFAFDGLLQRRGFFGCDWEEAEYSPPETAEGLNSLQFQ